MRKLFFIAAFSASITVIYAQDLKDVQEKISKQKYDEAKEKLDKFMADPKNANNPNAYFYKAQINFYLSYYDSLGKLTYDASNESFQAFKKTLELQPQNILMTADNNRSFYGLFELQYNKGIKRYNEKKYEEAFNFLGRAVAIQDYGKSKNLTTLQYTPPVLDTQLIHLTASSAYLAKKEDTAIAYFERLFNAKIATPDFKDIYALAVQYYLNKNDAASADKYLTMGRQLYKDDDYWLSLEFNTPELRDYDKQIKDLRSQIEKATGAEKTNLQKQMEVVQDKQKIARMNRYEEMQHKYADNAALNLDYAIDLFNHTYVWETKPADYAQRQAKLQTALEKAVASNPTSGLAWFIASQHNYSQIFDLEDARRALTGNAPATANKRKEFNAQIDKKYDEMAMASQKAFDIYSAMTELKSQDKTNYRKVTDQLIDYYNRKKMPDKVTFYQNKKAAMK